MSRKVIFWTSRIDELVQGQGMVCGITVQMYFWSKFFAKKNWEAYSFTEKERNKSKVIEGVRFIYNKRYRHFNAFLKPFKCFKFVLKYRPSVIVQRGRSDDSFYLALLSIVFGFKFVLMIAADSSLLMGNEAYLNYETKLFRFSLRMVKNIVVQNERQRNLLRVNYLKGSCLLIPNIWVPNSVDVVKDKRIILWVGNIAEVKRPLMYLDMVESFQKSFNMNDVSFFMIGGAADKKLYDVVRLKAWSLSNVSFLGSCDFSETNRLFREAKILICTSSSEGFPNTFLQAWANGIPIVTTFDPSGVIKKHNLGVVVSDVDDLYDAVKELNENDVLYSNISKNVREYFDETYKVENQYDSLVENFNLLLG